jgi:TfoX/Sxy family transcriptional regulator of competence genes
MLDFLKELLDDATSSLPDVSPRRAFGSWGYYVDGRIFALAYAREDRLGVKLPDSAAHAAARSLPGSSEWAPHGSPMSGWVLLPAEMLDDREAVQAWVARAFQLVRAAPASALRTPGKRAVKGPGATSKKPPRTPGSGPKRAAVRKKASPRGAR